MRKRMTGVIVAGVVLVAGAALAQTAGSSLEPASRGIIPVTGPSTVASLPESARPEVVPAVAQGEVVPAAGVSPKGTVTRQAPRTVKAVHKPAPKKATVAKASAAKHVAKTAGAAKGKHVAVVKHRPLAHHAAVSKPIPVTKHQVPAKNAAPTQPVLPRV